MVACKQIKRKQNFKNTMHSLEANASPAGRVLVASQDVVGGRISPNINIATPNLATLRKPSVPFVLPNFIDIC